MIEFEEARNPPAQALAMLAGERRIAPQARLVFFYDGDERGYAVVCNGIVMRAFGVEEMCQEDEIENRRGKHR